MQSLESARCELAGCPLHSAGNKLKIGHRRLQCRVTESITIHNLTQKTYVAILYKPDLVLYTRSGTLHNISLQPD